MSAHVVKRRTFPRCGTCARFFRAVAQETPEEATIGDLISDAMAARGLRVRELARLVAGPGADHRAVENVRRQLYRYLDDTVPDEATALKLSRELGVPVEKLTRPASARVGRGRIQRLERRLEALEERDDVEQLGTRLDAEVERLKIAVERLTGRVERLEGASRSEGNPG